MILTKVLKKGKEKAGLRLWGVHHEKRIRSADSSIITHKKL